MGSMLPTDRRWMLVVDGRVVGALDEFEIPEIHVVVDPVDDLLANGLLVAARKRDAVRRLLADAMDAGELRCWT